MTCPRCRGRMLIEPGTMADPDAQRVCLMCGYRAYVAPFTPRRLANGHDQARGAVCEACGGAFTSSRFARFCSRTCFLAGAARKAEAS